MLSSTMLSTMLSRKSYRRRLIRIWALGFVGLGVIFVEVNCWHFFQLERDGAPMRATVTAVAPDNRDPIKYSYEVDGGPYDGEGSGGYGNPAVATVQAGAVLKGYYLPAHPSVSCLGEPGPQLRHKLAFALFWALLIPSVIIFRASRRYDQWLRREEARRDALAKAEAEAAPSGSGPPGNSKG